MLVRDGVSCVTSCVSMLSPVVLTKYSCLTELGDSASWIP